MQTGKGAMADGPRDELTRILQDARDGNEAAASRLLPLVYDELRQLAGAYFRTQNRDHTLQPTALVHEAYVRLINSDHAEWNDRAHFFAVAATAMRQILIDHARRKGADKRGGSWKQVPMDQASNHADLGHNLDLLALDEAMQRLSKRNPRKAQVVELRVFGGLTCDETAAVLGITSKAAEADWYGARAWLRRELSDERN